MTSMNAYHAAAAAAAAQQQQAAAAMSSRMAAAASMHAAAAAASTSNTAAVVPHFQPPSHSLEATAARNAIARRRPRLAAREYAQITPQRLAMSLKCGAETETIFALNALTALLYDDTYCPPIPVSHNYRVVSITVCVVVI